MNPIRRIVTGHDEAGMAVFVEDADSPHARSIRGVSTNNLWRHSGTPDNSGDYADPITADVGLEPPADGAVLRVVDFPPDKDSVADRHRTASLDYAVVLDGEIHAVLDTDETIMRAGASSSSAAPSTRGSIGRIASAASCSSSSTPSRSEPALVVQIIHV